MNQMAMTSASIPESDQIVVAALYKFVSLPDFEAIKPKLEEICVQNNILGTLLLAAEGINGTVSGPRPGIVAMMEFLWADYSVPLTAKSLAVRMAVLMADLSAATRVLSMVDAMEPARAVAMGFGWVGE